MTEGQPSRKFRIRIAEIHSVAESGGLSDERRFAAILRSASQRCRLVNDDRLTASFCNRHLRFSSVAVPSPQSGCEWFAEFARRLIVTTNLQLTSAASEPLISLSSPCR